MRRVWIQKSRRHRESNRENRLAKSDIFIRFTDIVARRSPFLRVTPNIKSIYDSPGAL